MLKYTCEHCGFTWNENEKTIIVHGNQIHEITEDESEGYQCPNCASDNVGAITLN